MRIFKFALQSSAVSKFVSLLSQPHAHSLVCDMSAPISIYHHHQFKLHRIKLIVYSIDKLLVEQKGQIVTIFLCNAITISSRSLAINMYSTLWTTDFAIQ